MFSLKDAEKKIKEIGATACSTAGEAPGNSRGDTNRREYPTADQGCL